MAITAKQPGQRGSNRRYAFYFRDQNKTVAASPWEARGRRGASCVAHRATATILLRAAQATDSGATVLVEVQVAADLVWAKMDSLAWSFRKESFLLQRFAVNLINANNAAYKIPVLLIRESTIVCRPGKLARRLWMIWIVHEIAIAGIRR